MKVSHLESRNWSKSKSDGKDHLINGPKSSFLKLKVSGDMVTEEFLNMIRRTVLDFVPSYAFEKKDINITKNTTNLNNDMLKYRISQLPIFNIDVKQKYIKEPISYVDPALGNIDKDKDIIKIDMFIKVENKKRDILNITTNDVQIYVNDEKKDLYNKTDPILILQLVPNSEFVCHAQASLGIGRVNAIWSPGQVHYYDEGKDYVLVVKSTGQLSEKDILRNACKNIRHKMESISDKINQLEFDTSKTNFIIELDDEDFTCTSLINYYIQSNKHVDFSGLVREDHNIDNVTFKIIVNGITIPKLFKQAIKEALEPVEKFEEQIGKI